MRCTDTSLDAPTVSFSSVNTKPYNINHLGGHMAVNVYFHGKHIETIVCQSDMRSMHHVKDPDVFLDLIASFEALGFTIEIL